MWKRRHALLPSDLVHVGLNVLFFFWSKSVLKIGSQNRLLGEVIDFLNEPQKF